MKIETKQKCNDEIMPKGQKSHLKEFPEQFEQQNQVTLDEYSKYKINVYEFILMIYYE